MLMCYVCEITSQNSWYSRSAKQMNCYLTLTQSWATLNWMWNQKHYWSAMLGPMETIWLYSCIYRKCGWWGTAIWWFRGICPLKKNCKWDVFHGVLNSLLLPSSLLTLQVTFFVASFTELHVTHISVCALKSVGQKAVAIMPDTKSGSTATWPEQCLMWQMKHQMCWNTKPVVTVMNEFIGYGASVQFIQ